MKKASCRNAAAGSQYAEGLSISYIAADRTVAAIRENGVTMAAEIKYVCGALKWRLWREEYSRRRSLFEAMINDAVNRKYHGVAAGVNRRGNLSGWRRLAVASQQPSASMAYQRRNFISPAGGLSCGEANISREEISKSCQQNAILCQLSSMTEGRKRLFVKISMRRAEKLNIV